MATSGSVNFSINRNDIITDAMQTVGALGVGESLQAADVELCVRKLNMMVKSWMQQGYHLWAMSEATLFLEPGDQSYALGSTGDHCTNSYVSTTLSTNEATSSTSIGLTSASGMSASDNIGIVLDDGTIHWTTISGAPSTTTTIATGLASAATAGNVVFAYTTKINRPQRIISAYRRDIDDNDLPIRLVSRQEYSDLSSKSSEGKTVQAFYDRQLVNGVFYTWPTADLATDVIRFWYERPLEDFDGVNDTPDFPIEWSEALCAGLAYRIAKPFGVSRSDIADLKTDAQIMLDIALGFDKDDTSVTFQPEIR